MVKEKTGNSFSDNSNLPKLNFAGLCSLESFSKFLKSGFVVFFLKISAKFIERRNFKKNLRNFFCNFEKQKKSSIADALPFPDAIDEPENLTANLNPSSQNENDENVISNLISALSTHSRPPIQSGLRLVLYRH